MNGPNCNIFFLLINSYNIHEISSKTERKREKKASEKEEKLSKKKKNLEE